MLGMLLLKHTYGLSDEQVWDRWVHDPYFQYFTGEAFFHHELKHERSGLSHWRKRIGDHLDILLQETLRLAVDTGAMKEERPGAGHGGHHGAAEEHHLPDRRQAPGGGNPSVGQVGEEA